MGRFVVLLLLLLALSVPSALLLIDIDDGSSTAKVIYMDGDCILEEDACDGPIRLKDVDPSACDGRTFFGWCQSPDMSGDLLVPGHAVNVEGELRLYAVTAYGKMSSEEGNLCFDICEGHRCPSVMDFRYMPYTGHVRISFAAIDSLYFHSSPMRMMFQNGVEIGFDESTVSDFHDIMSEGVLDIGLRMLDDGMDVDVTSESDVLEGISGRMDVSVPMFVPEGSEFFAFHSSDHGIEAFNKVISGDHVSFSVNELGYRWTFLYGLEFIGSDGFDTESEGSPEILTDSANYMQRNMFAKGDTFSLPDLPKGSYYEVTGAILGDEGYVVSGQSGVTIAIVKGNMMYGISLPSEQIGYSITSDVDEVSDGGRCVLMYSLKSGYGDDGLLIKVNGRAVEPDGMSRIFLEDIHSDQMVSVSGVYDLRTFEIILPDIMDGYVMVSSERVVHYGLSYSLTFNLLPDYEFGEDFVVMVNGELVEMVDGVVDISGVTAIQRVSVCGVQLKTYTISVGEHVSLMIDGYEVTSATCRDIVSLYVDDGYAMPLNYDMYIPVTVHPVSEGYTVSGDSYFPGICTLTLGDNVISGTHGERTSFTVCSEEVVSVNSDSGYELPDGYSLKLTSMGGVTVSANGYKFSEDCSLPSVYRVSYWGYSSIFRTIYAAEGDNIPQILQIPVKECYTFTCWDNTVSAVFSDLDVISYWTPISYDVLFGNNFYYTIDGVMYSGTNLKSLTVENTIVISPKYGYEIPENYLSSYSLVKENVNNGFLLHVTSDYEFKTINKLTYVYESNYVSFFYSKDTNLTLYQPYSEELSDLFIEIPNGSFMGWYVDDCEYYTQEYTVNSDCMLYARWST